MRIDEKLHGESRSGAVSAQSLIPANRVNLERENYDTILFFGYAVCHSVPDSMALKLMVN